MKPAQCNFRALLLEPTGLDLGPDVHVDHVFPFRWMNTGRWRGPSLNGVWNLVLACAPCNLKKSGRLPTDEEITRLIARNDAIAESRVPLRRTLELSMDAAGANASDRRLQFHPQRLDIGNDGLARPGPNLCIGHCRIPQEAIHGGADVLAVSNPAGAQGLTQFRGIFRGVS